MSCALSTAEKAGRDRLEQELPAPGPQQHTREERRRPAVARRTPGRGAHYRARRGRRPAARGTRRRPRARRPPSRAGVRGRGLLADPDAQQYPDRLEPVSPRDLLPLRVRPAVIRDRQLIDAELPLADLRGDLRLDREVVLAEVEAAEHVAAEGLVPGLSRLSVVLQRRPVSRERNRLPTSARRGRRAAACHPTGASRDDIRAPALDRLHERGDVGRVVSMSASWMTAISPSIRGIAARIAAPLPCSPAGR